MSSSESHYSSGDALDRLFEQLRAASTQTEAEAIVEAIWERWLQHDDPEIMSLMRTGRDALEREAFDDASTSFTAAIERDPYYAEAWNKRGIVKYVSGDYASALRDMQRTVELEPRHFGALSGIGAIYLIVMARGEALRVFERLLDVYPLAPNVRKQVRVLRDTLGDNG